MNISLLAGWAVHARDSVKAIPSETRGRLHFRLSMATMGPVVTPILPCFCPVYGIASNILSKCAIGAPHSGCIGLQWRDFRVGGVRVSEFPTMAEIGFEGLRIRDHRQQSSEAWAFLPLRHASESAASRRLRCPKDMLGREVAERFITCSR